ncbi:TetR/AcrR family transcriptional regulator [Corynebacterium guaraldiae]|uniref:TetR/AcrR family transcriptional regulator n=1 Tax=Corynebacterium guaraldiae TaxID=3051103 RepID=UPI002094CDF6|nr:hypothetical protein [Corynebacterium guaraldiae]
MRAVAQQVGVAPASLYSRVESVDDLFDLALDVVLADDPVMSESINNADLPALMQAFFTHLTTHRWPVRSSACVPPEALLTWPFLSVCACCLNERESQIRWELPTGYQT